MAPLQFASADPPDWQDRSLAIVGAGPSLTDFNFKQLALPNARVLAVNGSIFDLLFIADAAFSLDFRWIKLNGETLRESAKYMDVYLSVQEPTVPGATHLRYRHLPQGGLSDDPLVIECGYTSGYGALNLAYLKRAPRIVLFGFDYSGGHYDPSRYLHYRRHAAWPTWAKHFQTTVAQLRARHVEVFNASPESTIECFPRISIEAGLALLQ